MSKIVSIFVMLNYLCKTKTKNLMKKLKLMVMSLMMVIVGVFLVSCNDKVSDKLSTSDVKSLIKKDTLYETLIPRIQKIQDSVSKNVLLNAKFSDITYQQCLKYQKEKIKEKEIFTEKYKKDIDKKLNSLKSEIDAFRKTMKVEFYSTSIFFYDYIGGVKDGYFKFKISVNEPIQGGSFRYSFKDKTTGKEIVSGRCRFSENIKDSYVGVWEIPYSNRDEFGYQSVNEIKNRYNIDFTILSVYKNNSLKTDSLSNDVSLSSDIYKTLLLKKYNINLYDTEYVMFNSLSEKDLYNLIIFYEYSKEWEAICKKIDPEVFEYFSIL